MQMVGTPLLDQAKKQKFEVPKGSVLEQILQLWRTGFLSKDKS
jgi:hypothetical protein